MTLTLQDLLSVTALVAIVQFLAAKLVEKRIEGSIRHDYDKKLEQFRFEMRRREQASRVAKLLAMRFRQPPPSPTEFNELAWELSLWLPPDLVRELTSCLCGAAGAKQPKEILIAIRKQLQGSGDDLRPEQIVHMESEGRLT